MTKPASLVRPFDDARGFALQLQTALAEANESVWLVAPNFADWPLETVSIHDALREFLREHAHAVLRVLLDDETHLATAAPRFAVLRTRYSHLVECRRTPERVTLHDACVIVDERHVLRRVDPARFRGELAFDDSKTVDALLDLYRPLWDESTVCLPPTTLGL